MPRIVPLLSGLALATAVTYKFRNDLVKDQGDIKSRLNQAKSTLERAVTEESYTRGPSYLIDSQKYVSDRLVPSGKKIYINDSKKKGSIDSFLL
ncbi:hypothetical protein BDF21DRAFT_428937 [Thamnidium elegans]|nr:hypothetical protein BDF21DRAFT_428937 [Thamnidium elegans]